MPCEICVSPHPTAQPDLFTRPIHAMPEFTACIIHEGVSLEVTASTTDIALEQVRAQLAAATHVPAHRQRLLTINASDSSPAQILMVSQLRAAAADGILLLDAQAWQPPNCSAADNMPASGSADDIAEVQSVASAVVQGELRSDSVLPTGAWQALYEQASSSDGAVLDAAGAGLTTPASTTLLRCAANTSAWPAPAEACADEAGVPSDRHTEPDRRTRAAVMASAIALHAAQAAIDSNAHARAYGSFSGRLAAARQAAYSYTDPALHRDVWSTIPLCRFALTALARVWQACCAEEEITAAALPSDWEWARHSAYSVGVLRSLQRWARTHEHIAGGARGAAAAGSVQAGQGVWAAACSAQSWSHDSRSVLQAAWRLALLRELTSWFKADFFQWTNTLPCGACGGETRAGGGVQPSPAEARDGARITELHVCRLCDTTTRFPRLNRPAAVLAARRGRCGEWANAFTATATAAGWWARKVDDWTDHLWTELWFPPCSAHPRSAWLHVDACEAAIDNPHMYETGWGKKLNCIVATGVQHCMDVTPAYTRAWLDVLTRRAAIAPEPALAAMVNASNWQLLSTAVVQPARSSAVSASTIAASVRAGHGITSHGLLEWARMAGATVAAARLQSTSLAANLLGDVQRTSDAEFQGRLSGALAWRQQRGEVGHAVAPSTTPSLRGAAGLGSDGPASSEHGTVLHGGWTDAGFSLCIQWPAGSLPLLAAHTLVVAPNDAPTDGPAPMVQWIPLHMLLPIQPELSPKAGAVRTGAVLAALKAAELPVTRCAALAAATAAPTPAAKAACLAAAPPVLSAASLHALVPAADIDSPAQRLLAAQRVLHPNSAPTAIIQLPNLPFRLGTALRITLCELPGTLVPSCGGEQSQQRWIQACLGHAVAYAEL